MVVECGFSNCNYYVIVIFFYFFRRLFENEEKYEFREKERDRETVGKTRSNFDQKGRLNSIVQKTIMMKKMQLSMVHELNEMT